MTRAFRTVVVGLLAAVAGATAAPVTTADASSAATPTATSACTVRGPLMGLAPYPGTRSDSPPPFVHLQATNGRGTYAGVSFTSTTVGLSFTVVRRDPTGVVRVLGRFVYRGQGVDLAGRTVRVVGVDASGAATVTVQRTDTSIGSDNLIAVRYDAAGVRHDLARSPSWRSTAAVGVADTGSVLGDVVTADGKHQVVIWRGAGSGVLSVLTGPNHRAKAIAANGDWYDEGVPATFSWVHLHGDRGVRPLTALDGAVTSEIQVRGASAAAAVGVDGTVSSTPGVLGAGASWAPDGAPGTAPLPPTRLAPVVDVTAVGRSGDVVGVLPGSVGGLTGPHVLRAATGAVHPVPPEYAPPGNEALSEVVDSVGKVVFTGSERLPMVLTCPR